jgi:translation initiation factor RLI1
MTKTMTGAEVPGTPVQTFKLHVERGQFTDSEIVVMLGASGFDCCFRAFLHAGRKLIWPSLLSFC